MRFEYIVLLIIAFNVITAVAQRRAKKARAEQAARSAGAGHGPRPHEAAEWDEEEDSELEAELERRERAENERRAWEDRRREAAESVASAPDERRIEKMPSLGRDIFDQLARDLGLKIPRSEVPPAEVPSRPRETRRPVSVAREPERKLYRQELRSESPTAARARALEEKAPEKLATARARSLEAPDLSAGARAPAASRPLPAVPHESARPARPDLRDPRKLREAFVVKEILDAPVSRRPRR